MYMYIHLVGIVYMYLYITVNLTYTFYIHVVDSTSTMSKKVNHVIFEFPFTSHFNLVQDQYYVIIAV